MLRWPLWSSSSGSTIHRRGSSHLLVVVSSRRRKGYHFFVDLTDAKATERHVREELDRLADDAKKDSTAYLHSLLNLALSYYQQSDYINARDIAQYTHEKAMQHNPASSFLFLSAKTNARCAAKLAEEYAAHVERMEEQLVSPHSTLAPSPSVVFKAKRAIQKLNDDAARYEGIAKRIYQRPDMAFMRPHGRGGRAGCSDERWAWEEGSSSAAVDDEYEEFVFGSRHQQRRKRPEHAEMKHFYKKKQERGDGRWTVPK